MNRAQRSESARQNTGIIVTTTDLSRHATWVEGTQYHSSLTLYARILSDLERCSVLIVLEDGTVWEEIDREAEAEIARMMAQVDMRLFGVRPRRKARAR